MSRSTRTDDGVGLVEVVIAITLLALIALALAPVLWDGIKYSSEQTSVATATRKLNALVEEMRAEPTCARLAAVAAAEDFEDGRGLKLTSTGLDDDENPPVCTEGALATLHLRVLVSSSKAVLAETTALVYIPGA